MSEPVAVAWARDEVEAAMIQGLLDGAGIPSAQQQLSPSGAMLGIPFLSPGGGARRILVEPQRAEEAEALLADVLVEDEEPDPSEGAT